MRTGRRSGASDAPYDTAMSKRRRRLWSLVLFAVIALVSGGVTAACIAISRPEVVRSFAATATFTAQGTGVVHESIDYFFPSDRHGIYRVIPGVAWSDTTSIDVSADHTRTFEVRPDISTVETQMIADGIDRLTLDMTGMYGVKVKIGDPDRTVSGLHHYELSYPLGNSSLGAGRFGWNGVGAAWDVPIEDVTLTMLAPWRWTDPTCFAGTSGSMNRCTITQPEPGHLQVTHGRLAAGEGITVYATAGSPLPVTPGGVPATTVATADAPWWERASRMGGSVALVVLIAALVTSRLLRRAGRDWVVLAHTGTGTMPDVAPGPPLDDGVVPGAIRVDDARLDRWVGTESTPPRELEPWQGGIIARETATVDHRVAWLLQAAEDGYISLDQTAPRQILMRRSAHAPDDVTALLDIAFGGRDTVTLGSYDSAFTMMWDALTNQQEQWFDTSVYQDHRADRRVIRTQVLGGLLVLAGVVGGVIGSVLVHDSGLVMVGLCLAGALTGGVGVGLSLRAWELRVRTPVGSAMWLRLEAFRRFLASMRAEQVDGLVQGGVLARYSAWAVALGERRHWGTVVATVQEPLEALDLWTPEIYQTLPGACRSTSTTPSSSGGSGGGGGGGGGSW